MYYYHADCRSSFHRSINPQAGSWVNQRHQICSLDHVKELFKHDGNWFSTQLNIYLPLKMGTNQMVKGKSIQGKNINPGQACFSGGTPENFIFRELGNLNFKYMYVCMLRFHCSGGWLERWLADSQLAKKVSVTRPFLPPHPVTCYS